MPAWPSSLSGGLIEFFDLIETATGATLAFLWAALYIRHRRLERPPAALTLQELYALDPTNFEAYVAALFRQKGYRVVLRGGSGDHGVDLELIGREGRRAVVQCKRYQNTVGEDVVRDLYGTLVHEQAGRAFLVTTAEVSDAARQWAFSKPITLIDGPTLVQIAASLSQRQEVR
jgi:restriction system protein